MRAPGRGVRQQLRRQLKPCSHAQILLQGRGFNRAEHRLHRNGMAARLRIAGAMPGRRADSSFAGVARAQVSIQHGAMVLAMATAAGRQAGVVAPGCGMDQRRATKQHEDQQLHDGGGATHVLLSLNGGKQQAQRKRRSSTLSLFHLPCSLISIPLPSVLCSSALCPLLSALCSLISASFRPSPPSTISRDV